MKHLSTFTLLIGSLLLAGCESTSEARVGMTEKQWLRTAVLSDLTYAEGSMKAYKSNRQYYYFRDGVLVKIDPSRISAEEFETPSRSPQMAAPTDVYSELKKLDELRKSGIITDEEFQAQKKKILER